MYRTIDLGFLACRAGVRGRRAGGVKPITEVELAGIINDAFKAFVDLGRRKSVFRFQPALDILAKRSPRLRELAGHRGFMFAGEPANLRERHLLRIVAGEAQPIARRERGDGSREYGMHRGDETRAFRVSGRGGSKVRRRRCSRFFIRERNQPACLAVAIDVPLRDQRSQPGCEAAAAVEIPEHRLPDAIVFLEAEQLRVKCFGNLARAAGGIDRIGRAIHTGPELAHEMVPRIFTAHGARAGERKIAEVQRIEIAIELAVRRRAAGERFFSAALERVRQHLARKLPSSRVRLRVEPLGAPRIHLFDNYRRPAQKRRQPRRPRVALGRLRTREDDGAIRERRQRKRNAAVARVGRGGNHQGAGQRVAGLRPGPRVDTATDQ